MSRKFFFKLGVVLFTGLFSGTSQVRGGELIKRSQRVYLIEQAGLQNEVKGMDELDQDLFVMRALNHELAALVAKYPKISKAKLSKLKTLALQVER